MPQKTNILLSSYIELVKEWHPLKNENKSPEDFAQFSNKKVWWKCKKGPDHEWNASVESRTKRNQNCPFCVNKRVSVTNRFDLHQPELLKEWNYKKNTIKPSEITIGTNKKVWWVCKKGHEWEVKVASRVQAGDGCKICNNPRRGEKKAYIKGDWVSERLDLLEQWMYEKNNILGKPSDFASSSSKKVWWKCSNGPDHEWEAEVRKRVQKNTNCPYCNGKKVSVTNSFALLHPEIAQEWHPLKNENKSPEDFAQFSNKKVWWKCKKGPDHEWETAISRRVKENNNCPFCSGVKLSSTNNLLDNAPEIASQFDLEKNFPKTPNDFTIGSNESVWWKCENPKHRPWKAPIAARMRQSTGCYICNQEERFASETRLFNVVAEIYPNYQIERTIRPSWLDGLEIDIFIPEIRLAIEYQGRQHYEPIEFFGGNDAFKKRIELDNKKRILLNENGIRLLEWKYTLAITKSAVEKEINKIVTF